MENIPTLYLKFDFEKAKEIAEKIILEAIGLSQNMTSKYKLV